MPALKSVGGGIAIMSHTDTVKISLTMDVQVMDDPLPLMELIYENLDLALGKEWREF